MTTKVLARFGPHGKRVAVSTDGERITVRWSMPDGGARKKKTWPDTRANRIEAKAWAERFASARGQQVIIPIRTDEVWRRYVADQFPLLRAKTQQLYSDYWRKWQAFVGRESIAEDMGPDTMASFRTALDVTGLGPNTVSRILQTVKTVYAWARTHRHVSRNDVRDYRYKVPKDRRPKRIPEYRAEELAAILGELPLGGATTWRAAGVLALCGLQGARVNAVLHLRWEDIDLEAGTIHWRPEWDKQGKDEMSPLRTRTREVLAVIRARVAGAGWVFPAGSRRNKHETYSVQSLTVALHAAEHRAGLESVRGKGSHSLRRMLFNDVLGATGDIGSAMAAIRDTSLQVASKYMRGRDERVRAAFATLDTDGPKMAPQDVSRETAGMGSDADATA